MLKGKNIVLRPLKTEDIEKTIQWRNDIDLIINTQGVRFPKTREMESDWFDNVLHDTSNRNIYWGIDEIESCELIGIIQLNNLDWISRTAEFGISIGNTSKRGKGIGKEAMCLLFDYVFKLINLRKITLKVTQNNEIAINLYKKIGFKEEGRLLNQTFLNNKYYDVLLLSLFVEDYYINH